MKNYEAFLNEYLQENRQHIIDDLMELVRIPSILGEAREGAPFGEKTREALDAASWRMKRMGFFVEIPSHGAYGYCDYGDGPKTIGLIPHVDVVPPNGEWEHDPFDPIIRDGFIIGRGVSDDKGGAIGSMYAFDALAKAGVKLKNKARLIFCCNEEKDMSADVEYLVRDGVKPDFSLIPDAFFPIGVGEKGYVAITLTSAARLSAIREFTGGKDDGSSVPEYARCVIDSSAGAIEQLEKLCGDGELFGYESTANGIEIFARGVAAHPVMPESGRNAVWMLADLLSKLEALPAEDSRAMASIAKLTEGYLGEGMGIAFEDAVSGKQSCVCIKADLESAGMRLRFVIKNCVTTDIEQLQAELEKTAQSNGFALEINNYWPAHYISPDDERVRALMDGYFKALGQKPEVYVHPGNTYAGRLKDAVIFGNEFRAPGPFGASRGRAHQLDEVTDVDHLVQSVRAYFYAILALDEIM